MGWRCPQEEHVWEVYAGFTRTTLRSASSALAHKVWVKADQAASAILLASLRFLSILRTTSASTAMKPKRLISLQTSCSMKFLRRLRERLSNPAPSVPPLFPLFPPFWAFVGFRLAPDHAGPPSRAKPG